jgi:acyl-CoA reductase-like NAD-dependent aldehyde dehydrogenase
VDFGLLINNREVPAANGARFERRDPISDVLVSTAAAATIKDACASMDSAAASFASWGKIGPKRRSDILLVAAGKLLERGRDFTRLMMGETGASSPWVGFNIRLAAGILREAASLTTQIKGEIMGGDESGG